MGPSRACMSALVALGLFASAGPGSATTSPAPALDRPAPSQPGELDLATLLARFATIPGLVAPFHEEKRLSLLREPLVSRGVVYYAPPQRLARVVDEPAPARVVVDGQRLVFMSAGERGAIGLDAHPMLRVFVDSLRMLLHGDVDGLHETFHITFARVGPAKELGWSVLLRPREDPLRRFLTSIRIAGNDRAIRTFRIRERNGDETRMTFSTVDPKHRFSAREIADIFGTAGP